MVREIVMLMRMVKWCGITGLQLVAAILCIICLGALPRLFKGLQIDLIGFGTRLYFLEESYFNREITYGFSGLKKIISANMDSLFRDNVCVYFGIFTVITYCISSRCVGITTISIKATNVEWDFCRT